MTVEVYGDPGEEYQIEGSSEIRRKVDASTYVVLGKDVFSLCIKPGFDGAIWTGFTAADWRGCFGLQLLLLRLPWKKKKNQQLSSLASVIAALIHSSLTTIILANGSSSPSAFPSHKGPASRGPVPGTR